MTRTFVMLLIAAVLLIGLMAGPASAIKVYVNPSIQTNNTSPDGTYNEGYSMQDVASRLMNKLTARGFSARNSGWLSLSGACNDAVSWDADSFVAIHTNAMGGGWTTAHGTDGFYYTSSGGWYDPVDLDLCEHAVHKVVQKFSAYGRGYDRGSHGDYPYMGFNFYVLANTPGMNSILIEGLFHDNVDDCALLKTANGKEAYASGLYEGICDFYGWSYATWNSAYNAQSYVSSMAPGQQAVCWVEYKNTGGTTWTNSGSNPVRLGTWNPQDRSSAFYTAGDWLGANRPTNMDQASVGPNGIGRFTFTMTAPGTTGSYTEYWRLVAENLTWFGYDGVWFGITVSQPEIIIDNTSGSFSCSANWATGTSSTDKYGSDYRYRSTAAVSDPATWTPNIPVAGNWEVYAWWPQGTNRSASAPYIITYNGGSTTVSVNQQTNGGRWNSLGTYNFAAGTAGNVKLSCWTTTGFNVMADAVRFVKR